MRQQGQYSPDNPFAPKKYSADNPFAAVAVSDATNMREPTPPPATIPDPHGLARYAADTFSVGLAPKIGGGVDALRAKLKGEPTDSVYTKGVADRREGVANFKARSPYAALGLDLASLLALAPLKVGAGITGAMKTLGALGAVQGFAHTDGSPLNQVIGTGVGTALGAAGAGAFAGAPRMAESIASRLGIRSQEQIQTAAAQQLRNMLEKETGPHADFRVPEGTPGSVVADQMGPGGLGMLRKATQMSDKAALRVQGQLGRRQADQPQGILDDLQKAANLPSEYGPAQAERLGAARESEASPLYEIAKKAGPLDNPEVVDFGKAMVADPTMGKFWRQATGVSRVKPPVRVDEVPFRGTYEEALAQGILPASVAKQVEAGVLRGAVKGPAAKILNLKTKIETVIPTAELVANFKRIVASDIEDAAKLGEAGTINLTEKKAALEAADDLLRTHVPEYKEADAIYTGRSGQMESAGRGHKIFSGDPEATAAANAKNMRVVAEHGNDMDTETPFRSAGLFEAQRAVRDKAHVLGETPDVSAVLGAGDAPQRIAPLMESPAYGARFQRQLSIRQRMAESARAGGGNVNPYEAAALGAPDSHAARAVGSFATGAPHTGVVNAAIAAARGGGAKDQRRVQGALAEYLMGPSPREAVSRAGRADAFRAAQDRGLGKIGYGVSSILARALGYQ